ncbi:MAG: sensor histidine kinase [Vicinamibacterales bacterium]
MLAALADRLSMRIILLAGFGLVLGLGLMFGVYFARRMADVQREAEDINRRYAVSQELLTTLRTQVLLGAIYVRDALLDQTPGSTAEYRRRLEATLEAATAALQKYEPVIDSESERAPIRQLKTQFADFQQTVLDALASDSTQQPREARLLLRNRIIPKRESVIRVFEDVELLNRNAVAHRQSAIAGVYRTTERRIWVQLAVSLCASFVIGFVAIRRVETLEARLLEQQRRDAENAHDLQRLSAQLVTAQEDERRTIARELHDEVGQVLTAIKVELAVAQRTVDGIGGSSLLLADARSITERALHTVRDLSHLLHPAMLDDLGLAAAVEAHVREFRRRHDLPTEFVQERMEERLPQAIEVAAYRLVQEALTNVAKHARATVCRVHLQRLTNTVLVTIEDNGVGFDHAATSVNGEPAGLGLLGMRERVAQLYGSIRVETAPGRGTRIAIVLPTTGSAGGAVSGPRVMEETV